MNTYEVHIKFVVACSSCTLAPEAVNFSHSQCIWVSWLGSESLISRGGGLVFQGDLGECGTPGEKGDKGGPAMSS